MNDQLQQLYDTKELSDIVFEVGTSDVKTFHAHKLILAMASELFESWFYQKYPDSLAKLRLTKVEPKYFEILLRFIYTNDFQVDSITTAIQVAYAAKMFFLHDLLIICLTYIEENLTVVNIWETYNLALDMELATLEEMARELIAKEESIVFDQPEFLKCDETVIASLTESLSIDTPRPDPKTLIVALTKWAKCKLGKASNDINAVREMVMPYLPYLDFLTLTPEAFANAMSSTNILTDEEFTLIALNIVGFKDRRLPSWCDDNPLI